MKCFLYLRTSSDDGKDKAGLVVQREACTMYAARSGFEIVGEFADDGVTGKLPMHARPQGRLLIAALLADGVKTVLTYDAKRIGRTQPAFWSFAGQCRDLGIVILDCEGSDLRESLKGGFEGLMAEMDYKATIERLARGKRVHRGSKRVDGRWPYGEHPSHEHDIEREVVQRIRKWHENGVSSYAIAKRLEKEGTRTRYGKTFTTKSVQNILGRQSAERAER